ncbi:MAG: glycosyltransferase [Chlorobiaceae bacterium]|nr:glycosyltransferase [Chlorobiaceae bacterium]NTV60146.1 glycosyltransferase [Chlorobiaceae bacterium]
MFLLVYQILVLFSLLVFFGIMLMNLRDLAPLPESGVARGPFVSVLVPARNEMLNIERCVRSLLRQDYLDYEIIVLDDGSTDETPSMLRGLLAEAGTRMRVLQGEQLPPGWHGKAWACFQLAREAKGELMLFTDADTFHEPDALRRSAGALVESGADMLSLTPRQELGSFWEKLVVPLVYVILMSYLPIRFVSRTKIPAFCFANGQFILARREIYRKIHGHASVRNVLVEDVWLCREVKKTGGRVVAFDGTSAVSCRMYRSFQGIWEGFSKNLFAGFGYRTAGFFLLMLLVSVFYILPYVFLAAAFFGAVFTPAMFWLPFAQVLLAILSRLAIAVKFRQPFISALLHVFSQLALLAIACNSFYLIRSGKGARWKGRRYNFS